MGRFGRSFTLAKASWQVLLSEKSMLGYTAISAVLTVIAVAVLAAPAVGLLLVTGSNPESGSGGNSPLAWVLLFIFYLVISFITLFFNTALVGAALARLRGGDADFHQGMQIAVKNLGHIFVYAIISATVGIVLAIIEERLEAVGRIVAGLIGGAWAIVTFLVVPVMVAENVSPFDAIKRSGALLRKTWGEQIIGGAGIGLVIFLFSLLAAIPIVLAVLTGVTAIIAAGVVIAVIYLCVVFLIGSALSGVYRAALYLYATTGSSAPPFNSDLLAVAFRPKGTSRIVH
jgi:hypothetical protein